MSRGTHRADRRRPPRRGRGTAGVIALVLVLALAGLAGALGGAYTTGSKARMYGSLQTDPGKAVQEHGSGLRVAHLSIAWDGFEPRPGVVDPAYVARKKAELRTFRQAGLRVEAGLALHHPPGWLADRYPDAVWTNQYGDKDTGTANLVFSRDVRRAAARFLAEVDREIGLNGFWAVRIGVDESGEFAYPGPAPGHGGDGGPPQFWAFDRNARSQERATSGRPATVPPTPYPGWRPGDRTYRGRPFTAAQAMEWNDWYLAALADAVDWQIARYTELGHTGRLKILLPGTGYLPATRVEAARDRLGSHTSGLLGRGVGFLTSVGMLEAAEGPARDRLLLVSTALADGSGHPPDNSCEPSDAAVQLADPAERTVRDWSSPRWVAAVAARHGLQVAGETAGEHVAPYHPGVMADVAEQVRTCDVTSLMWAFDRNLHDGTPGSSLRDYARMIDRTG